MSRVSPWVAKAALDRISAAFATRPSGAPQAEEILLMSSIIYRMRRSRRSGGVEAPAWASARRRPAAPGPIAAAAAVADVFRLELCPLRQLVDDHRVIVGEEAVGRARGRVLGPPGRRLDQAAGGDEALRLGLVGLDGEVGMAEGGFGGERRRLGQRDRVALAGRGHQQDAAAAILDLLAGLGLGPPIDAVAETMLRLLVGGGVAHRVIDIDLAGAPADLAVDDDGSDNVERALRRREIRHAHANPSAFP